MSEANNGRRFAVIGVIVISMFAGLLTRLWFLQVTGGEKLAVAAQQNHEKFKTDDAQRGTIYDRTGKILAQNVTKTALVVDRKSLTPAKRLTLEKSLGGLLHVDAAGVDQLIDDPKYSPYEPVPVAIDISADVEQFWAEHQDDFPDVTRARTTVRVYPYGVAAAQVLGYTGGINAAELAVHRSDGYSTHDTIGKTGVEQTFESELRGVPGLEKIEVKADLTQSEPIVVRKAQAGHDVQLTIDIDTQKSVEESLQQGIDGAKRLVDPDSGSYYRANAGAVIVLDARTGSLVAMASNPTYDPNELTNGTVSKALFDPNGGLPLLDRAMNQYAPGSTFKTFTSIAMLQSGIRNATDTVDDEGCFEFGNNEKRCNAKKEKYFIVDLRRALTVSSDVYFYNVGNAFWNVYNAKGAGREGGDAGTDHPVGYAMQTVARTYGFDEPTGVGLTGDADGRIPDLAFNRALNKNNPDQFSRTWRRGDSASLAVGQGDVLVTPLQLADAYAAFANGGTLVHALAWCRPATKQRRIAEGSARGHRARHRSAGEAHHCAQRRHAGRNPRRARRRGERRRRHRGRLVPRLPGSARGGQDRYRPGGLQEHRRDQVPGHLVVRGHHQSRERPCAAAVRRPDHGRAGRVRRRRRRAHRPPSDRLPERQH